MTAFMRGAGMVLALALLPLAHGARATGLDAIASQLAAGDAAGAYAVLAPQASERAGDPEFDRLLGAAARGAGRPAEAIFALERALDARPDDAEARLELARAYVDIGDLGAAEAELDQLSAQSDATPGLSARVDSVFARIRDARTRLRGHVALTFGFDDNVNSSPDAIVAPGGFVIAAPDLAALTERDDLFGRLSAGVDYSRPVAPNLRFAARARAFARLHPDEDNFDTGAGDGRAGLVWTTGPHEAGADAIAQRLYVDGKPFRDVLGVVGRWGYRFNARSRLTGTLSASRLAYEDQSARDANRYVGGATWLQRFPSWHNATALIGGYGGTERETSSGVPHLGHNLFGFNVGGGFELMRQAEVYAFMNYEDRSYGGVDPTFRVSRDDERWRLRIGARYTPAPKWTVIPEFAHIRADSSIPVNEFERNVVSITLRRDFE